MINPKTIIGVVIVAILVGVLYVLFEKNLTGNNSLSQPKIFSSNQNPRLEAETPKPTSVINYPTPVPALSPIDGSSNISSEAENLEMRDYSEIFEDLKGKVTE